MPLFPSEEWIQEFVKVVNKSKEYEEAAKKWEGDFVFVITPDGTGNLKEEIYYYMDLWHGKCRSAYQIKSISDKNAKFIYRGPYGNWIKVIKRELDPIQGLMQGKFKLKGDMAMIMRNVKAAQALVNCIKEVETEFL